ncbi:hypothetical protein [Kitasatospora sp. NPDC057198]|uniref:hypothetical protein n=1 Tax=Kitasatospora sp. NPDC057198 TaxID=3346046 RepID=UPI003632D7B9
MKDDRAPQPPRRAPLRRTLYALLALYGGLLLCGSAYWWFGWSWAVVEVLPFAWAVVLAVVVIYGFRTRNGLVAGVLAALLAVGVSATGFDAIHAVVLERYGQRTTAVVVDGRLNGDRTAYSSCRLRTRDGRDVPRRLDPCDGFRPGNRLDVTYDPDGRQDPVVGAPDAAANPAWTGGLLAALTLLLLSLPLWAGRGPRWPVLMDDLLLGARPEWWGRRRPGPPVAG